MKVECDKTKLRNAIIAAEKITAKNPTLPVLSLVIIETQKNNLIIKSTNLEVGLEVVVPAKIIKPGKVAIEAQVLNQLLNSLTKDEKIILESINNNISVNTNKTSTLLKSQESDDFPKIPRITDGYTLTLPPLSFILAVKSVIYAASVSDIKPEIASVYIYQNSGYLYFVATDSFRLAEKRIVWQGNDNFLPLIIPLKNISNIIRILDQTDGDLEIQATENQISFITNNFYLTSRVINSVFPDYRQIIPKESKTEVVINKTELFDYLKTAIIFSDKFNQISFNISVANNVFEVYSKNQDLGENSIKTESNLSGEDLIIHFNARYLIEPLNYINSDKINLLFNGNNKPLMVKGEGDESFRYLIMPVNR